MQLNRSSGFSLVELMVAMIAGLGVAAIALTLYVAIVKANSTSIQSARLSQALQASMDVMERDIRRAGYIANAANNLARDTNGLPITPIDRSAMFSLYVSGSTTTLQDLHSTSPNYTCVLLRYDNNDDGVIAGTDELMGYRFNSTNQAIEFKQWSSIKNAGGSGQLDEKCSDTGAAWTSITDDGSTQITVLTFTIAPSSGASTALGQRTITLSLSGQNSHNTALDMQLQRQVRLRNDQF